MLGSAGVSRVCVAEAALSRFHAWRSMALSLAPHNIRVNAVGPGSILTDVLAAGERAVGCCGAGRRTLAGSAGAGSGERGGATRLKPACCKHQLLPSRLRVQW